MTTCDVCGKEVHLPFKCKYCGKILCPEHRLPENHSCEQFKKTYSSRRQTPPPDDSKRRLSWDFPSEVHYEVRMPVFRAEKPSFWKNFVLRRASMLILILIFIVFIIQLIAEAALGPAYFIPGDHTTFLYYLAPSPSTLLTRPWTVLTSIFVHGGFLHMLVNTMVLFFFGPALELRIGRKKFLYLFFGAGALAAISQVLIMQLDTVVVGASGAILGVLGTLTVLAPRLPVLLFFFIPMPLWMVTLGFGALSAILVILAPGGSIANMAHLTGILVGLGYGYKLREDERKSYRHFFRQFLGPWI